MLKFPKIKNEPIPPHARMNLIEYAHFSELCLRSNKYFTSENCIRKHADERNIRIPFTRR